MRKIDLATWPASRQYHLFRGFERPHFAITTRLDVTRMKASGRAPFHAALHAMGAGLAAVEAMRLRFHDGGVVAYDQVQITPPIALDDGTFGFGYFDWTADTGAFDRHAAQIIADVRAKKTFDADAGAPWVTYASCLPWLDFTALDNAMPHADDCIPRLAWGKIVPKGDGFDMAASIQVHHALVAGRDVGAFFEAVQSALDMA